MTASTVPAKVSWLTPGLLLALTLVPVAAGVARLVWLTTGENRPDSARFAAAPAPLVMHILSIIIFGVLGAFQFSPDIRNRWPGWHRIAGRVLAPAGLVAAFTGLWMTLMYPPGVDDGQLLFALRLFFGSAMAVSLLRGLDAIRRRNLSEHVSWMLRAYAIGMGAGTQVFTTAAWLLLVGPTHELSRAVLMGAGWMANLVAAEWIIRRRPAAPRLTPALTHA